MAFPRPTRDALLARVAASMEAELQNGAVYIRRTFERATAAAMGGLSDSMHAHISWAARQLIMDRAEDELLVRWADIFLGANSRKQPTKAEFPVSFTGLASAPIPINSQLVRDDGVAFETIAAASIPATPPLSVEVQVRALEAGSDGNTVPLSVLQTQSAIADIDPDVTVVGSGSQPIGGGADIERIEALRARLLDHLQDPPKGGAKGDYVKWALESASYVTRAWELPLQLGPSTVLVLFVQDTFDEDGFYESTTFPGSTEIAEVQAYLESKAPVSVALNGITVQAPTALPLNPTIELSPNTATVQQQVTRQLEDLLLRRAAPSSTLSISQIREAISIAQGEDFHTLVAPAADVTTSATEIHTLGTITFQDA